MGLVSSLWFIRPLLVLGPPANDDRITNASEFTRIVDTCHNVSVRASPVTLVGPDP